MATTNGAADHELSLIANHAGKGKGLFFGVARASRFFYMYVMLRPTRLAEKDLNAGEIQWCRPVELRHFVLLCFFG